MVRMIRLLYTKNLGESKAQGPYNTGKMSILGTGRAQGVCTQCMCISYLCISVSIRVTTVCCYFTISSWYPKGSASECPKTPAAQRFGFRWAQSAEFNIDT